MKTINRLYRNYRPLSFFGILALVLAIISLIFFIPIMVSFIQTHTVEKIPTLIVCGFVMIAAIQSFFTGLMLENIRQKDRQDFETKYIQAYQGKMNNNRS